MAMFGGGFNDAHNQFAGGGFMPTQQPDQGMGTGGKVRRGQEVGRQAIHELCSCTTLFSYDGKDVSRPSAFIVQLDTTPCLALAAKLSRPLFEKMHALRLG